MTQIAIYALFGVVGTAGVGIAAIQGNTDDIKVNALVLGCVIIASILDKRNQDDQMTSAKASMENEKLALNLYIDGGTGKKEDLQPRQETVKFERIQTAADLIAQQDNGVDDE